MSLPITFISLPPELIERTLILSASAGYPACISTLARTCKYLHGLVYNSPDHHLWRQVFLTTFDDPRPGVAYLKCADTLGFSPVNAEFDLQPFNWAGEFIRRIKAAKYFKRYADAAQDNSQDQLSAVKTLLSVISTALPYPPPNAVKFGSSFSPVNARVPLLYVFNSRNMAWMMNVLKRGYPSALTKRMFSSQTEEFWPLKSVKWDESEEGQLLHKLFFLTGFPPDPEFDTAMLGTGYSEPNSQLFGDHDAPVPTAHRLVRLARRLARRIVYDLQYLTRARSWGPFIEQKIVFPSSDRTNAVARDASDAALNSTLNALDGDEDEDSSDEEYQPSDPEDTEDDYDNNGLDNLLNRITNPTNPSSPHLIVPDYAFLAAARVLVEANSANLASVERLPRSLECTRMGTAPDFWTRGWINQLGDGDEAQTNERGIRTEMTGTDVQGWDWAGVAGEWKRCVCWLDYEDLLSHNLLQGMSIINNELQLDEIAWVFPMTLRIAGYSGPPARPEGSPAAGPSSTTSLSYDSSSLIWKLPVIHVEGESIGSDVDFHTRKRIKGTVSAIGDNAVRWSLTSFVDEESDEPQWVTEGVQIGGIGSAAGVLGVWTGAEHHGMDPLGPFWAWKVR